MLLNYSNGLQHLLPVASVAVLAAGVWSDSQGHPLRVSYSPRLCACSMVFGSREKSPQFRTVPGEARGLSWSLPGSQSALKGQSCPSPGRPFLRTLDLAPPWSPNPRNETWCEDVWSFLRLKLSEETGSLVLVGAAARGWEARAGGPGTRAWRCWAHRTHPLSDCPRACGTRGLDKSGEESLEGKGRNPDGEGSQAEGQGAAGGGWAGSQR